MNGRMLRVNKMIDQNGTRELDELLKETFGIVASAAKEYEYSIHKKEIGRITSISGSIVWAKGLPNVSYEEIVEFTGNKAGIAFNLDRDRIAVVLLDESENIRAGGPVYRTGRILDVPVGEGLMGRVIDPLGRPRDGKGPVKAETRKPSEKEAPAIMDRAPVSVPLQTGLLVVDALIPVGRGQRELILGDRQTGKTAIALDTIVNQKERGVICIYCAIGQRASAVAKVIDDLEERGAMEYSAVVVATGEDSPGLNFAAPYAATTIGEYFMDQGKDALVIYDDLTRHARAYREASLLLRRPPAREAYPGDIFYIHSRLLERSTHLKEEYGGGSLTALPIIETQAENLSAYIPTNLISITDGQIYLSPKLFEEGRMPAVEVGRSVSRVGGKTQLPAYRGVAGDLRLSYSQFEELESFARFGTRLDDETRKTLARGRRVREILKQKEFDPMTVPEQIAVITAVNQGVFDPLELDEIYDAEEKIRKNVSEERPDICRKIKKGETLNDEDINSLTKFAEQMTGRNSEDN